MSTVSATGLEVTRAERVKDPLQRNESREEARPESLSDLSLSLVA